MRREITFNRKIDIDTTIKNLVEKGIAIDWKPRHKKIIPTIFREKSVKEIKKELKKNTNLPVIIFLTGWIGCIGFLLGVLIGLCTIHFYPLAFPIGIFAIIIYLILSLVISKKWRKWIYFPSSNSIVFVGNFSEEEIQTIKSYIKFGKARGESF